MTAQVESNRRLVQSARGMLNTGKPKTHLSPQEVLISQLCTALTETTDRLEELELVYGEDS